MAELPAPGDHQQQLARPPLSAVEWLRVTHAGTLSGRRVEEALAAAEQRGARRVAERVRELADSYGRWPFRVDPVSVARRLDAIAAALETTDDREDRDG